MAKTNNDDRDLILEANRINYSLRATFFYRKLRELGYLKIIKDVEKIVKQSRNYSWEDKKFWNITYNAWETIEKEKIDFIRVFVHPKILVEHPTLIRYYRNVAAIPLKGVQYLTNNITDYESGKRDVVKYSGCTGMGKTF